MINARGAEALERTARELSEAYGVTVTPVAADITTAKGRARVLDALGLRDTFHAASAPSHGVELRDAGGALVLAMDFTRARPQARFRTIHRARLL